MARIRTMPKGGRVAVLAENVRLPFTKKTAVKSAGKILAALNRGSGGVCILFVNDAGIRRLNKKYRKRDRATDVLTFETGDIVISAETAGRNAKRFGSTIEDELKLCMIHGILHLSGYDDTSCTGRKKMRVIEERILHKI